ncbi:MAG: hypothetical protein COA47_15705 [Robiginitomaculum sp.]|nr:MAG: hypothetical protein COA47_15705 [Robiginitomaculum sp.]
MNLPTRILLGASLALALSYLFAPELTNYPMQALIKTVPVWILAWVAFTQAPPTLRAPLALALVFSGFGDFALASPMALSFPLGMLAFLIGHLFYLWIFTRQLRPWRQLDGSRRLMILLLAGYAIVMGGLILPRTGVLMPAIAVYFAVLTVMAAASFAGWAPRWTRLGALLFVLSDTLIGIDRFLVPLEFRHIAVMSTYYTAQVLIMAGLCWQNKKT